MRSILTTAPLEDSDRRIYQKPGFMFRDAAPDNDHQLLAGEEQWIFKLDGEKYYLPSSKRHFPLSFFQCVMRARKMQWQVTRTTDSIHVRKLIILSPGYTRVGPPRCILGLHPGNILPDIPVGENPAVIRPLEISSLKFVAIIQPLISGLQGGFTLPRHGGGVGPKAFHPSFDDD